MLSAQPSPWRAPRAFACACALALAAGCGHADHPLSPPASVEGFCGPKQVRETALLSILTSTNDRIVPNSHPNEADLRARLLRSGGALGRWDDELLRIPQTARLLGEADGFVRVRAAVAVDAPEGATSQSQPASEPGPTSRSGGSNDVLTPKFDSAPAGAGKAGQAPASGAHGVEPATQGKK